MVHLIDRDALVAEIERLENKLYYEPENFKDVGAKMALDSLKSSLDTLEVKEMQEEPVSEDYRGRYKNITQSDAFKSAYENKSLGEVMSVEGENPVSEDLEEASKKYALNNTPWDDCVNEMQESFKAGAQWRKKRMIKSVLASQEMTCIQVAHRLIGSSWNLACPTDKIGLKSNDKVKVIIIKEE